MAAPAFRADRGHHCRRPAVPAAGAVPLHRSSSCCRWARRPGTASTTGTVTARRRSSSGWRNFELLFANRAFRIALINNLLIIVVSLAVQLPLALAMAVLLADRIRGTATFRLIFFLPYILAEVAAGLIWRFVYDGEYGLVAKIWETLRGRAALRARRARPRDVRHPGRGRLEVFRLPHDALHRRPAADRPQPLRGGAHRRRDRLADFRRITVPLARVRRSACRCSSPSSARSSSST